MRKNRFNEKTYPANDATNSTENNLKNTQTIQITRTRPNLTISVQDDIINPPEVPAIAKKGDFGRFVDRVRNSINLGSIINQISGFIEKKRLFIC